MPVGLGIGATQPAWLVMSFMRAAGLLLIITVAEPLLIIPGPAGVQPGNMQGAVISVTRAAGWPPIRTVAAPVMIANGMGG